GGAPLRVARAARLTRRRPARRRSPERGRVRSTRRGAHGTWVFHVEPATARRAASALHAGARCAHGAFVVAVCRGASSTHPAHAPSNHRRYASPDTTHERAAAPSLAKARIVPRGTRRRSAAGPYAVGERLCSTWNNPSEVRGAGSVGRTGSGETFHVEHPPSDHWPAPRASTPPRWPPSRYSFHVERSEVPDPAALAVLETGLRELALPAALAEPLAALACLLAQWAARMNLTGHRSPEAIARRLVLDALAFGQALGLGEPASLADLGSGAGFPGLPLAILWPRCRVTLVEARERRHHFQRAAVRTLGLVNAEPRRGRIETLAPEPHQVVVAQALARPEQAIGLVLPWVAPGGWLVLPLAAGAAPIAPPAPLAHARIAAYQVPAGGPERSLWAAHRPLDAAPPPVVSTGRPP